MPTVTDLLVELGLPAVGFGAWFAAYGAARTLTRATRVTPVYATGEEQGTHFYAMEVIDGPSLDHVIRQMRQEPGSAASTPNASAGGKLSPDVAQTGPYVGVPQAPVRRRG